MEVKLWNELNDVQAEKIAGGEGIGEFVSGANQRLQDAARDDGYHNMNQALRFGAIIVAPFGVYGPPYGQLVSDSTEYWRNRLASV